MTIPGRLRMPIRTAVGLLLVAAAASAAPLDLVVTGRTTFIRYCASCHGVGGDGTGPAAPALITRPPDLRQLHGRYGEPLDRERIGSVIDGRSPVAAHGSREMPVWGERFDLPPDDESRERTITERVSELIGYLESIQRDR